MPLRTFVRTNPEQAGARSATGGCPRLPFAQSNQVQAGTRARSGMRGGLAAPIVRTIRAMSNVTADQWLDRRTGLGRWDMDH